MALHLVVNMKNIYGPSNRHDYESNSFDLYCDKTCAAAGLTKSRYPSCEASSYVLVSEHSGNGPISFLWRTTGSYRRGLMLTVCYRVC